MTQLETSFEDLYEHSPCGHMSLTTDGMIVRVNSTFLDWTGYAAADLVGRPFAELLTRGSQIFAETRYLPVLLLEGAVKEVALTLVCADGSDLPTLVNSVVVEQAGEEPGLIRTAVFDATDRQNYERDLLTSRRQAEASEEHVRVLQRASSAFVSSSSEEELAEAIVESMRHGFAAASVAVLLTDESGKLALAAGERPGSEEGPELEALSSRQTVVLSDRRAVRDRYPTLADELKSARLEAVTATPLSFEGAASGVVLCYYGRARSFDGDAIDLQEAVARQASEALARVRLQRRLERMALFDQLTGLANRQLLKVRLEEALATGQRTHHSTALIFLDLDGFKTVNDELGHVAGDEVLREVATRLRSTIRPSDVAGRFGGDEFVVICEDADVDAASAVAERLRDVVGAPISGIPDEFTVSASIGVAVHSPGISQSVTPDRLFDLADTAMYTSKNSGKNRTTAVIVA
ncbi:sensor domain-containing protein [Leifsonia flava]|uniref:Diguanylate cyclase n=1 Tax=Orlajensenia leifsoniae TaxID=2561933 RepID=A0A4Y9R5F9_9MICO|nr:diguanylate cyclase [Leifsonia flava]TFV99819.1 diguanylate cyclase [Leifsonia flava]